jgi:CheY-like chemotaxis protein
MARILIIDDDDPFRTQLRPLVEAWGYEVVEAWDGREGIRAYRAAPTDLVITDIIMPEQEGLETVRALRQEFPTITIVAMTGSRLFALDLLERPG